MIISLFGGSVVFIAMIAGMLNDLIDDLSTCYWVIIATAVVTPATMPGTPKDFWYVIYK